MSLDEEDLELIGAGFYVILLALKDIKDSLTTNFEGVEMDFTTLKDAVERDTTVNQSAITLLNQLGDLIREHMNDPAELATLADNLNANSDMLAAAVEANTGSVTPPTPVNSFVTKVEGETWEDYNVRLVTYNSQVSIENQAPALSLEEWTARPVG